MQMLFGRTEGWQQMRSWQATSTSPAVTPHSSLNPSTMSFESIEQVRQRKDNRNSNLDKTQQLPLAVWNTLDSCLRLVMSPSSLNYYTTSLEESLTHKRVKKKNRTMPWLNGKSNSTAALLDWIDYFQGPCNPKFLAARISYNSLFHSTHNIFIFIDI